MSLREEDNRVKNMFIAQLTMLNECDFLLKTAIFDERNSGEHGRRTKGLLSDIDSFMGIFQKPKQLRSPEFYKECPGCEGQMSSQSTRCMACHLEHKSRKANPNPRYKPHGKGPEGTPRGVRPGRGRAGTGRHLLRDE
tara:strand:- start:727 stop:1140 length:414 start_codon:yes stop_codon:yes gene_type:complete